MLFINRKRPPHPDYTNVERSGRGWYHYRNGKWRRYDWTTFDPDAKYLTDSKLFDLAVDAVVVARGKK
jgi:hypothetical protein